MDATPRGQAKIFLIGGEEAAGTGQAKIRRWFTRGMSYEGFMWKLLVDYASVASGGKLVGSTPGISNAGDVLHPDESRYAISACDLPQKKFIIKLAETIYLDKLGLVSAEFYAATYRHIQVLGSSKWPTNEWRVLGEIETNPLATAEVFDLSDSSKCAKCFVRFIKLRVLSHHTIEGFSRCALTRVQVFGSTLLESIDRLSQGVDSPGAGTLGAAVTVSLMSAVDVVDRRLKGDFSDPPSATGGKSESEPGLPDSGSGGHSGFSADSPLLKFIEDMTELQRNYAKVSASVSSLVAALQNAQSEISTLKYSGAHNVSSNVSISDLGLVKPAEGNAGISEFFQTWQPVLFGLLAFSQLVLFIKLAGDAGIVNSAAVSSRAGSPSRLAALRRSESSPRLKARFSMFSKRKSIARLVTGNGLAGDKHRGLFKGTAAFKAARHVALDARPRAISLD
jgi:hypothetical protein